MSVGKTGGASHVNDSQLGGALASEEAHKKHKHHHKGDGGSDQDLNSAIQALSNQMSTNNLAAQQPQQANHSPHAK